MSTFNSSPATIIKATATGLNGSGGIAISGLKSGDVIFRILPGPGFESGIEQIVSVDDQLQQNSSFDWSGVNFTFYLLRGV